MDTIFVIIWKHSDNSGFGVVRVYGDKDTAESDLAMLRQHADKQFDLVEAQYIEA